MFSLVGKDHAVIFKNSFDFFGILRADLQPEGAPSQALAGQPCAEALFFQKPTCLLRVGDGRKSNDKGLHGTSR